MVAVAEDIFDDDDLYEEESDSVLEVFKDAIIQAKQNPEQFFKEILGTELDKWQIELVQAVLDVERFRNGEPTVCNHEGKDKITVRAMHGPGKTFGIAGIMHLFNFIYQGRIIATAPKEKQLITRLWPAFRKIKSTALPFYQNLTVVDTTKITWVNNPDWVALAETASQPENLAGYHDDYMLFLVEEASGVDEQLFPVIEGALSTGKIVIFIMISNPTKNTGTFYDSHNRDKVSKHYYKLHVSLDKTSRVSPLWVKQMEDKYGKDSPVVKVRCHGDFAEDDENQLIALSWIERARADTFSEDGSLPRLRVTVDVADGGTDESVITVAKMYDSFTVIQKKYRYNFPTAESPILCAEAAMQIADDWGYVLSNGDDIVVDSLGVGSGTAGTIIKTHRYNVVIYKGGEASDDAKEWRNRRTQSYMGLRDAYRDNTLLILDTVWDTDEDWDDYLAQTCSIKSKPGAERVEDLMTKDEMKRKGIKSPDMADGDAMIFATQQPVIGTNGPDEPEVVGESVSASYDGGLS